MPPRGKTRRTAPVQHKRAVREAISRETKSRDVQLQLIPAPKFKPIIDEIVPFAMNEIPKNSTIVVINPSVILEPKGGNIILGGGRTLKGGRDNIIIGGDVSSPLTCDSIIIGNTSKDFGDHTVTINVAGLENRGFFTNAIAYGSSTDSLGYVPSGNGKQIVASSSSRRFRTSETIFERMPDILDALAPTKTRWKEDAGIATPGEVDIGLIAEDVAKIWPMAITRDSDGQISNVRYNWVLMLLLREVQYLRTTMKKWGMKDE